jgi:hypothetical protein
MEKRAVIDEEITPATDELKAQMAKLQLGIGGRIKSADMDHDLLKQEIRDALEQDINKHLADQVCDRFKK